jgi:ubiquitin C-terminal hydrolase
VFNLYGFVIHEGSQSRQGHYKSVVKGLDDVWYLCNDSVITKLGRPITKEDTENAYMLFYHKQPQLVPNPEDKTKKSLRVAFPSV